MGSKRVLNNTSQLQERIAVFSDGTCETAENHVRAILALFEKSSVEILRFPKIRDERQLIEALNKIQSPFLVAYTFATEKLRKKMWSETKSRNLLGVDILFPALDIFSQYLKSTPTEVQGIYRSTQALDYFERIEALEFTVKHDDGMKMSSIHDSDIILTGVSRTSKTPTSMYLAHKGYRVANVPLIHGINPPEALLTAKQHDVPVIFLTIDAQQLHKIRFSRLERLGTKANSSDSYVDLQRINDELTQSLKLARNQSWPIIDVTNKAVEETASEILLLVASKAS